MRRTALIITALIISASAAIADAAPTYSDIKDIPCKTYLSTIGTSLFTFVLEPITAHFYKLGKESETFGSACNIADYVAKVCKMHPDFNVEQAVIELIKRERGNLPLPKIGMCGA